MTNFDEIELDPHGYIAQGNGSLVYNHPHDPQILLKVPRLKRKKLRRRLTAMVRPSKRRYGLYREWYTEYEEYIAAVRKAGELPSCLPQPRGFVQTSLGPAFAVEKISDENATDLALTVQDYLKDNDPQDLKPALNQFFQDVEKFRIIFFDLKQHNLCVVRDPAGKPARVVSIDSIGENTILKVRKWSMIAYKVWLSNARQNFMAAIFPD